MPATENPIVTSSRLSTAPCSRSATPCGGTSTALQNKLKLHCANLQPRRKTKLTDGPTNLLCFSSADLGCADDGSRRHWVRLHHIARKTCGAVNRLPRQTAEAWAAGQRHADCERNQSHACNDAQLCHGASRQSLRRGLASHHHATVQQPHACHVVPKRTSTDTGTRRLRLQQYVRHGTLSLLSLLHAGRSSWLSRPLGIPHSAAERCKHTSLQIT